MIKRIFIAAFIMALSVSVFAQRGLPPTYNGDASPTPYDGKDEPHKGFQKDRLFLGGSIALGFASNTFNVGATPEVGYSVADWLDAGVAINLNYQSVRADPYYNGNVRQRSFNYGGGPFVRIYPVSFLFIQGQFEHNWIDINLKYINDGSTLAAHYQANSFLAGIGYTQRIVGQSSFYTAIMFDLMNDFNSPYRDYNHAAIPIIRAGFNFYLHPSRK